MARQTAKAADTVRKVTERKELEERADPRAKDERSLARTLVLAPVTVPVAVARWAAPRREEVPVYLGAGALAIVGALEWPVAAAVGVGYAALRRRGMVSVTFGRPSTGAGT